MFTFDIKETGKSYVVYTDYSKNEDNELITECSTYKYDFEKNNYNLEPLSSKAEISIVNDMIKQFKEEIISQRGNE